MGSLVSIGMCQSAEDTKVIKIRAPSIHVSRPVSAADSFRSGVGGHLTPRDKLVVEDVSDDMEVLDIGTIASTDPLLLFQNWFEQAQYSDGIRLATSMTLATASKEGRPSTRIVGVKGFDRAGFKIATNKNSRKAQDMDENPHASLMFYWEPMNRMVRVEGVVVRLDQAAVETIWHGFPRAAKLTHAASQQSAPVVSRQVVLQRRQHLEREFEDHAQDIPKHPDWCAYNVVPEWWEFYQVCTEVPDRLVFRRARVGESADGVSLHQGQQGWLIERLSP